MGAHRFFLTVLFFLASFWLTPAIAAGAGLQLDPAAVPRTRMPRLPAQPQAAVTAGTTSHAPASGAAAIAPAASTTVFSGRRYAVGATVTPTTTRPEAEEHIAVDPLNSAVLVAVVSDFSLRGGFNTTKYAYSLAGGAPHTWAEHFLPR